MPAKLIGIDGCRGGWLCIEHSSDMHTAWISRTFEDVIDRTGTAALIGIDIPIGLPAAGSRKCDQLARKMLGWPRGSSVFPAPVRAVLSVDEYARACEIHRATDGRAVTKQCFHLLPKIREVDVALRQNARLCDRVHEVHPEVSFAIWNGGAPIPSRKKTSTGKRQRADLIEGSWPSVISEARSQLSRGAYETDDLHDAIAALWSIIRYSSGIAESIPHTPENDECGLPMRILA
jgi:predicted RNase H-like nuclease